MLLFHRLSIIAMLFKVALLVFTKVFQSSLGYFAPRMDIKQKLNLIKTFSMDSIFLDFFAGHARPYLVFANKKDIRLVEVSPGRLAPKTTVVVKVKQQPSG